MRVVSPPWFDGTWWEADFPDGCAIGERSAQHVRCELATGARMLLGFRKNIATAQQAAARGPSASAAVSDAEQRSLELAKTQADPRFPAALPFLRKAPRLQRHELGVLVGYTYEKPSGDGGTLWEGFFGHGAWGVYLQVEYPPHTRDETRAVVGAIAASIQFNP